jgi:membrane protein implicated in regulation of membrane protease activity
MIFAVAVVAKLLWIESAWGWVLVGFAGVVDVAETFFWVWLSRRKRTQVGAETLVGKEAVVVTGCYPEGQVRVQGEIWKARCDDSADPGDRVSVEGIDGLTLRVRRAA